MGFGADDKQSFWLSHNPVLGKKFRGCNVFFMLMAQDFYMVCPLQTAGDALIWSTKSEK
jgi:hypothetical protein